VDFNHAPKCRFGWMLGSSPSMTVEAMPVSFLRHARPPSRASIRL
jgi:hypothetical protein